MSKETLLIYISFNNKDQKLINYVLENINIKNKNLILLHVHQTLHLNKELDDYLFTHSDSSSIEDDKLLKLQNLLNLENVKHYVKTANSVSSVIEDLTKIYNISHVFCSSSNSHLPFSKTTTLDIIKHTNLNVTVIK